MKTRQGFVSNSSSTSFVVLTKDYPTVQYLAAEMMKIRNDDWDDFDDEEIADLTIKHAETGDEKLLDQIRDALEIPTENQKELEFMLRSKIDPDFPTAFHTTNYDTYILKIGDKHLVSTCNNHDWLRLKRINSGVDPKILKQLLTKEEYKECEDDVLEWAEYNMQYATGFWWPKIDKVIFQYRDAKKCKSKSDRHYGEQLVKVDGKWVCPICDLKIGWL